MAERRRAEGKILKQEVEQPAEILHRNAIGFISIFPIVGFFSRVYALLEVAHASSRDHFLRENCPLHVLNIYYGIRRGRVGVVGGGGECIKIEELMGFSGLHSTLRSERENTESS